VIDAPDELRDLLMANVELVRWQSFEDMSEELLERLSREALVQAREAAATLGYFNAEVNIAVNRDETPALVTLRVLPGAPVRVAQVLLSVVGPAADGGEQGAAAIAKLQAEWRLPRGANWSQSVWNSAKQQAVAALAAGPWAAAKIVESEARIDPAADTAVLRVVIDSGPAFRFGALDVRGLARYRASLVENFSTLEPGAPYSAAELDQLVRRLAGSGYFSSVQATIDPDPAQAEAAPVQVAVIESRTKKVEAGLGFSTDTQFRANASYSDVDLDGKGLQFYADGRVEQKEQSATVRFVRPPTETHWRDTYSAVLLRTDIENLITQTAAVTARRVAVDERNQLAFGAGFFIDEQSPEGAQTIRSHALYADVQHTWRRVDNLVAPTRGYVVDLNVGAGVPGASTLTFGRAVGKLGFWWPLSATDDLAARAQLGAVIADSRDGIPSTFLFRTGGDTTVRGYAFESIGVQQGSATVGGRYELVTSAEVTHWLTPQWGVAAFVDAGNATDKVGDLAQLKLGYGLGARVRTPIGPFRLDIGYGQETHNVRLHFSIGLSF
jgi:translocation and assembly module TamA